MNISMSKFNICPNEESIFNLDQLWNTPTPIFNRCFLHTLPIWTPFAFLILLTPFHLYLLLKYHPKKSIHFNLYNISRLVSVTIIILVNFAQFCHDLYFYKERCSQLGVTRLDLGSSLLNICSYVLFGILLYIHRLYGVYTSGLAWLYTFTSLFSTFPQVYMYILVFTTPNQNHEIHWNLVELFIFSIHFTSLLFLFILTCFADQRPNEKRHSNHFHLNAIDSLRADLRNGISFGLLSSTSLIKRNLMPTYTFEKQQKVTQKECPDQRASFLSLRTYWWFYGLGFTGLHKTVTLDDLWRLNPGYHCKTIVGQFYKHWFDQFKVEHFGSTGRKKNPSIAVVLIKEYGWKFAMSTVLKLVHVLLVFALPQLLKICIEFISKPLSEAPTWHGYFIAFSFLFISTIQSFLLNYYLHVMYSMGMKIRSGLISLIYRKTLNLSNAARKRANTGEIINLMTVDSQRFADLLPFLNLIWSAPLLIGLTMYFLWIELGPSIFAGLAVMLFVFFCDRRVSKFEKGFQMEQMRRKDERVKVINELFSGIKVVKLHSYEMPFIKRLTSIRNLEIAQLERIAYIGVVTSFLWTSAPFMVSFATFSAYILSSEENTLDAKKAFVSLCLLNILRFPFAVIPQLFNTIVMASVSVKRMDTFFNDDEVEEYVEQEAGLEKDVVLEIKNGCFSWGVEDEFQIMQNRVVLNGINLKVKKGSLVAVCGYSGMGKSSLLSAILGDMERIEGTVNLASKESIAYVAQQSWIQDTTVRENILFGTNYISARYSTILDICALSPDINTLPSGDLTEIGEKGIHLSGGQKQRVGLARACYSKASLLLLDDPLSAVDSHVSKNIFQKVIGKAGFLKDRTRIIITNDCSFLPEFDQIILLRNGHIAETGTYQELMNSCQGFAKYIRENVETKRTQYKMNTLRFSEDISRSNSIDSVRSRKYTNYQKIPRENICVSEKTETGRVKLSVYANYFRLLTCLWMSMMMIGFVGMQVASVVSNIWLAIWSNDHHTAEDVTSPNTNKYLIADVSRRNKRLVVYTVIGVTQGLFFILGAVAMAKGTVNSSQTLHKVLLERMIKCPMIFFDSTPLGRIVNRFSTDLNIIDSIIPNILRALLICFLQVVSIFVLISTEVPEFMLVIFPMLFIYFIIQKFYVTISRQLKRLESVTRSPIFSHFGETFTGISTIRAFGRTHEFIEQSDNLVDINQQCCFPNFIANRWLASRLELCGNLIVFFVAIFAVNSREFYQTQPAFVALIVTYALNITNTLNWFIRMGSEMENNIVSVERIGEYCEIAVEPEWTRDMNVNPEMPDNWPENGEIEFVDFSVKYRKELNLVLNNINIKVMSGEKIGIVGRTGCGKSTLSLALFRILEATDGMILIDGIDISQIGLHELRSKLSIIPQDPVLFSGTIRSNLDPFERTSDDILWKTLELCHLRDFVITQNEGLDFEITENGSNLSLGQRQLICLGRALIRRTKILVLDEATAAIDLETDALIQQTIRREFAQCTVLTIAHRLHSIMDSDRVLVMHMGKVAEFDSPGNLLANTKSRFYEMAKDERLI